MQLNPYLVFDGRCEAAFNFYQKVLGGKIEAMLPHEGTPAEAHVPPAPTPAPAPAGQRAPAGPNGIRSRAA